MSDEKATGKRNLKIEKYMCMNVQLQLVNVQMNPTARPDKNVSSQKKTCATPNECTATCSGFMEGFSV